MDQKLYGIDKFSMYYYAQLLMKGTLMKFLVSVSLLTLFVLCYSSSSSSGFISLFPYSLSHEFNVYFSTYLFSIFTHTLERKYMFLICNGILAFLAKTSTSANAYSEVPDEDVAYVVDEIEQEPTSVAEEEEGEDGQQDAEEEQNGSLYTKNHEEISQAIISGEGSGTSLMKQGDAEMETVKAATNVNGDQCYLTGSSTDELNKKFEEFIRRMKEEMRIEAQRQPIAAV